LGTEIRNEAAIIAHVPNTIAPQQVERRSTEPHVPLCGVEDGSYYELTPFYLEFPSSEPL
jgi:hypothetical protein